MKIIGKILLFFSSYLLFFIVMLLNEIGNFINASKLENQIVENVTATEVVDTTPIIIMILIYSLFIFISIISVIIFRRTYSFGSIKNKTQITIKSISNGSEEIISYLITMIIPLLGDNFTSSVGLVNNWTKILSNIFIIIFILIIYINSNLVVINPTLVMLGYSINKICFYHTNSPKIEFEGVLLSNKKLDLTSISDKTLVEQIDINTFIIRRIINGQKKIREN